MILGFTPPRARPQSASTIERMNPVNLAAKLAQFSDYWQPRTIGKFNGHELRLAKARGEFVWHKHDDTDDFFLVLKGTLVIEREGTPNTGSAETAAPERWI